MQLDALPTDTGGAVRELDYYDWQSTEAREAYEEIRDLLGRELLDQRFAGMKQAMQNATPEDVERIRQMLDDLNELLADHAAGQDTTAQFDQFMAQHGEFFPENPRNTEELIDLLAQRAAAAQRMLNSMTRRAAGRADGAVPAGVRRPAAGPGHWPSWTPSCRGCGRARTGTAAAGSAATTRSGMGEATRAMEQLGQLDALAEQLAQSYPGARMEDIDLDALGAQLGDQARVDARALAELERELQRPGPVRAGPGRLAAAVAEGAAPARASRRCATSWTGSAAAAASGRRTAPVPPGRPPGPPGRGRSATPRRGTCRARCSTPSCAGPAATTGALDVTDVEIVETEQRTRAAVALCVDTSWSMVADGRWVPMKRTALALHQLISTRFRGDDLKLITFGRHAAAVRAGRAGRPGRRLGAGHQPAPRAAAGRRAPAPAPGRAAGGAGGHRRRADRAPGAGRRGGVRLAAEPGDAAGHRRPRWTG